MGAFKDLTGIRFGSLTVVDRVNVLGHYEPNNCRFITRSENSKGLRRWQAENLVSTA